MSALVNESGTATTRYTYDAFGNCSYTGEYSNNPFTYCGEYNDYLLGDIYLRARIYNSSTGRFTTEDPARDGLNWYAYCGNNPVMFKDPTGKIVESDKYYSYDVQKNLLNYTVNYLEFKIAGDMFSANNFKLLADIERNVNKPLNDFERAFSQDAIWMKYQIEMAFILADNLGLKKGSDDYAIVVTDFLVKAENNRQMINNNYEITAISVAASILLGPNGIITTPQNNYNPLRNIKYTKKVKEQMSKGVGEYHSFPKIVDNYGNYGNVKNIKGKDGLLRTLVEIPGSYGGKDGIFQYIIEADKTCNHRLFIPNK